jgi:hypothetical protein
MAVATLGGRLLLAVVTTLATTPILSLLSWLCRHDQDAEPVRQLEGAPVGS